MGEIVTTASVRLVFAGTSSFAVPVLHALHSKFRISAVITQPDRPAGRGHTVQLPPVKLKAMELHLPVHQPATLKNDEAHQLFEELAPEMLVVVAYGKLLPQWLLALPRYGAVNLHGSLLPRYRGAAPIQWAMANGDLETGVCTMKLDQGLDTGPVYACIKTTIGPDESVQQLSERLSTLGCDLIRRTIEGIVDGSLQATAQDSSRATLAPILTKEDGNIDWRLPARTIYNRMRAFHPWPGARAAFRDQICRILKARIKVGWGPDMGASPGTLVSSNGVERFLGVVCGDGILLEVLEIQLPNRKPQTGIDFINGFRVAAGEKLGNVQ